MFHVPEKYRITPYKAKLWKIGEDMASTAQNGNEGVFYFPPTYSGGTKMRGLWCIASSGMGWEHVSVHADGASGAGTPNWNEMCFVKDQFWGAEDIVVQYHPAKSEYVNTHEHTLHLWRPTGKVVMPSPPYYLVGMKKGQTQKQALAEAELDPSY